MTYDEHYHDQTAPGRFDWMLICERSKSSYSIQKLVSTPWFIPSLNAVLTLRSAKDKVKFWKKLLKHSSEPNIACLPTAITSKESWFGNRQSRPADQLSYIWELENLRPHTFLFLPFGKDTLLVSDIQYSQRKWVDRKSKRSVGKLVWILNFDWSKQSILGIYGFANTNHASICRSNIPSHCDEDKGFCLTAGLPFGEYFRPTMYLEIL